MAVRSPARFASGPLPICGRGGGSEVAPALLVALDRLEERLEVALAEAVRPPSLDDLEEEGRPVGDRLGEDLEQVPAGVPVDQDVQAFAGRPTGGRRPARRSRASS